MFLLGRKLRQVSLPVIGQYQLGTTASHSHRHMMRTRTDMKKQVHTACANQSIEVKMRIRRTAMHACIHGQEQLAREGAGQLWICDSRLLLMLPR